MKTDSLVQGSASMRDWAGLRLALILSLFGIAATPGHSAALVPNQAIGVRLASGFQITQYANESLADDIFAMTLDPQGRVVVTGPGYIRTLIDSNGDGIADTQKLFAPSKTGGMGMCFDGPYLYFVGDGGLWRYVDQDGDGVADGPPVSIMPIKFAEHGGHAIRQGPDGSWFLVAGNDAEIHPGLITDPRTPIRAPEAGMLLRFPPDFATSSVFAHGFRNPYDFDFGALGDLFVYDSDVERDYLLPWYTPTRIYHAGYGSHQGWRLPGFQRSFNRPAYYPGTTGILLSMGRGSPTGVVCYRHEQFPPRYHNGLFLLDWTFGRIHFANLEPVDSTFRSESEIFLDPIGTTGFAPTDAAVAPDGSLMVSIGGRKTRGSVYRIHYTAELSRSVLASNWVQLAATEVDAVLRAPQPLEAWSRAIWRPMAQRLGNRPFDLAAGADGLPDASRIRAIEILTELHGGMPTGVANSASRSTSPFVRARTAWSLGRIPCTGFSPLLARLAQDVSPQVRRSALEAISEQVEFVESPFVLQAAVANAGHQDRRLHQLSARLATFLPLTNWQSFFQTTSRSTPQARLTCALAVSWRYPTNGVQQGVIDLALGALKLSRSPAEQVEALGTLVLGLGDWQIHSPSVELYSAYQTVGTLEDGHPLAKQIRDAVRPLLLSRDPILTIEAARILGILHDPDPSLPGQLLGLITISSLTSDDFHYLSVLSRLPQGRDTNQVDRIASALLGINRKLGDEGNRPKQNWSDRYRELAEQLIRRSPTLPEALIRLPAFASESNLGLTDAFDFQHRQSAARVFLRLALQNRDLRWSAQLVRMLGLLPIKETRAVLRAQWSRLELRDELLLVLATAPQPEDREKLIAGLASTQPEVANASITALTRFPRDGAPASLDLSLRLLQRALRDKKPTITAAQVIGLINHLTGQSFAAPDPDADLAAARRICQPVFEWCSARYPTVAAGVGREADSAATFEKMLANTPWDKGNPTQGAGLYRIRGCGACHGGGANIAPDLLGVTRRWSPRDLFLQIKYPSKEVAEQYRAALIQTRQGASYLGLVSFYSADGVILRTADGRTVRVAQEDIASQRASTDSIMPEGLLDGLQANDLADFYAYLRSLDQPRP